tara:strand:- start:1331 stop:2062 length:732 start_codon:yes stop_codon:yes gene_type:complete
MATGITIGIRFNNGQIAYLQNDDVTSGAVGEEILTANQGGDLSQTSGVSVGQAYTGLIATHAFIKVQTQAATTARLLWGNFRGPDGAVITPIDGGGYAVGQMIPLYKPVRMTTGVVAFGAWEIENDTGTGTASLDVCSPVKCDNFTAVAVDGANTELTNKDGATIGQSMNGIVAQQMTGRYPATKGLSNALGGVGCLFVTASDGALKALVPVQSVSDGAYVGPSVTYPVRILQNDGAFVNSDT